MVPKATVRDRQIKVTARWWVLLELYTLPELNLKLNSGMQTNGQSRKVLAVSNCSKIQSKRK